MRLWLALIVGKICTLISRLSKQGGGSSLPGVLARRIEPRILRRLLERSAPRSVIITGTNGKTTTARIVAQILKRAGLSVVWNSSGANMMSGIVSALIEKCDVLGRLMADAAVFEVDEATLRHVVGDIRPEAIVVTNCFRDQLDRYGEVDTVLELIRVALKDMPAESTLILNADDPLVVSLARSSQGRILFYGLEDLGPAPESMVETDVDQYQLHDARNCPLCGARYEYSFVAYGHLGKYRCPKCQFGRPVPDFRATNITSQGAHGFRFTVALGEGPECGSLEASLGLPGIYNVYNCLAASACCLALGIPGRVIEEGIAQSSSAFGRMEKIQVCDRSVLIALAKNPVGFSEAVRSIMEEGSDKTILVCLNDNFADGRDISWIWDADIERLSRNSSSVRSVIASGTRADDMAVRLKYAGIPQEKISCRPDLSEALELGLSRVASGETLYILATYTAMLEIREHIRRRTAAVEFWRA